MAMARFVFLALLGCSVILVFGKPMQGDKKGTLKQGQMPVKKMGPKVAKHLCGNKDATEQQSKRKRRFIVNGAKWEKTPITWRLKNFSPHLNPFVTLLLTRRAFNEWHKYAGLSFTEVSTGQADIEISFEPKKHVLHDSTLCDLEFDGNGGTVGHAFYPNKMNAYGGNIHLDIDEKFSVDGKVGFNFGSTILHEIGHSLGLLHSDSRYSIMHPEFAMKAHGHDIQLAIDDILGIQSLYGPPEPDQWIEQNIQQQSQDESITASTSNSTSVSSKKVQENIIGVPEAKIEDGTAKNVVDLHVNSEESVMDGVRIAGRDTEVARLDRVASCPRSVDALFVSRFDQETYLFKGPYVYSIGDWLGYNKKHFYARDKYLFEVVDAAYRNKEGKLLLFSNRLYAVYRDDLVLEKYAAIYDLGFPYTVRKVDAALVFGPTNNTYFFTGDSYWRYNEKTRKMDPGYPKKISSVWKGVPSYLDAAITWKNGMTYFFKGKQYYRVYSHSAAVEPGYPKSIGEIWSHC